MELERCPSHGTVGLVVPEEDFALEYWSVENLPHLQFIFKEVTHVNLDILAGYVPFRATFNYGCTICLKRVQKKQ